MRRFGVTVLDNLQPRWNVAPSQRALVVTRTGLQPEADMVALGSAAGRRGTQFPDQCAYGNGCTKADLPRCLRLAVASSLPADGMNGPHRSDHGMFSLPTEG